MSNSTLAIALQQVGKKYVVHKEKPTFIEDLIHAGQNQKFTALQDINLQIECGNKVGIIGPNGAGKTTLLKIIAGITKPTKGSLKTRGKVVPLINLTAGFHPELSGRENIFLNGLLIGMSKSEILSKLKKIITFANIGSFIDRPLYKYSSGMQLRLGFSIAAHSDPDILLLDESISVGDGKFEQKAAAKIQDFFIQQKTIIIVSHKLRFINKHCNQVCWLQSGQIKTIGGSEVIEAYKRSLKKTI